MHGRVKVRTSAQEQEIKRKEREHKVRLYKAGIANVFKKRADGELDDELLACTAQMLVANPDIYTLWNIRKEILQLYKSQKSDAELRAAVCAEVSLTEQCLRTNPKSYGAWHHRGWSLGLHPEPDWGRELALCTKFLLLDERNFHCWDYRRLAAERSGASPQSEFAFTTSKIESNFSNYSAWHLRSKLLPLAHPDPQGLCPVSAEKHRQELELVQSAAFTDPGDTSAWFYQRWLLGRDCSAPLRPRAVPVLAWAGEGRALVVCSEPAAPGEPPTIRCGALELPGTWSQPEPRVWVLRGSWSPLTGEVTAEAAGRSLAMAGVGEGVFWGWGGEDEAPPPGVAAELGGQLDSCRQLLALEPNSKWTLLTLVLLMQALDRRRFHGEVMAALDQLPAIDPLRAGYYRDLRSRFLMEFQVPLLFESLAAPPSEVILSRRSLSALYLLPLLATVKVVDLSHNDLTQRCLPALAALQLCTTLRLDHNLLTSLEDLPHLPQVAVLSLSHNHLSESPGLVLQQLRAADLTTLREVHLEGNPCQNLPELVEFQEELKNK